MASPIYNASSDVDADKKAPRDETARKWPSRFRWCEICRKLLFLLRAPPHVRGSNELHVNLGSQAQVKTSQCPYHPALVASILANHDQSGTIDDLAILGFTGHDHVQLIGNIADSPSFELYESGELQLVKPNSFDPSKYTARLVSTYWVDYRLPRQWKEKCYSSHGTTCAAIAHDDNTRPTWVIDVWRQCIVRPASSDDYVALSYVWGGTPTFMTLVENVSDLQKPLALAFNHSSNDPIPRTVRDAMACVERVGERYLWVDTLCIVQDDMAQKASEINKMASIYANACLTIIAATGENAQAGLPGLTGISTARVATQRLHKLSPKVQIVESIGPSSGMNMVIRKWDTRGWTFQEDVFSRRKLVFDKGWVRWICVKDVWCEVGESRGEGNPRQTDIRTAFSLPLPSLDIFTSLVINYNRRDLTFPEDALGAFTGILNALSRTWHGGFVSGLPAAIFHIAILWEPQNVLVRREAKKKNETCCLPSWSWIGWNGLIAPFAWSPASDLVRISPHREGTFFLDRVKPLVQWKWHKSLGGAGVSIDYSWLRFKECATHDKPCPEGWTRFNVEESSCTEPRKIFKAPEPDKPPTHFYRHHLEPESEFWYPIPLPTKWDPTGEQAAAPFISCITKRAFLHMGEVIYPRFRKAGHVLSLRDVGGTWIGSLRLSEAPPATSQDPGPGSLSKRPVELVEVALGRVPNNARDWEQYQQVLDDWDHEERPRDDEFYEYYYVLWIEWENGVAYRKAIGRVHKDRWEAQKREKIDLIMG